MKPIKFIIFLLLPFFIISIVGGVLFSSAQISEKTFLIPETDDREACKAKLGNWYYLKCWDYQEEVDGIPYDNIAGKIDDTYQQYRISGVIENGVSNLIDSVKIIDKDDGRLFQVVYTNSNAASSLIIKGPLPDHKRKFSKIEVFLYRGEFLPRKNSPSPFKEFQPNNDIYARGILSVSNFTITEIRSNISPSRDALFKVSNAEDGSKIGRQSLPSNNSTNHMIADLALSDQILDQVFTGNNATVSNVVNIVSNTIKSYHFFGKLKSVTGDVVISAILNPYELFRLGNSEFTIRGEEAYLYGSIGARTYDQIQGIITNYPEVKTIVLRDVPGTVYAPFNHHVGRLLRQSGFNTKVLSDSVVVSGGLDLFLAGLERTVEKGGRLGVNDWCCYRNFSGMELPPDHPAHRHKIDYYAMILGEEMGRDFYFFTLRSKPFGREYWLTDKEIQKWGLSTEKR